MNDLLTTPVVERAYAVTRQTSNLAESARKVSEEFFKKIRAREVKIILKSRHPKPLPGNHPEVKLESTRKQKKNLTLSKVGRKRISRRQILDDSDSEEYKCNSSTLIS